MKIVKYYVIDKLDDKFIIRLYDENKNLVYDYKNLEKNQINNNIAETKLNSFNISWEDESDEIYLDDNSELLEMILSENKLYNTNFEKIELINSESVDLVIANLDEDTLITKLEINDNETECICIVDNYIYDGINIYKVDIVENYMYDINGLFTKLSKYDLEGFLTLVLKNYKNIDIRYLDYVVVQNNKHPILQLIIEKISIDNSLSMKLNFILSTMDYNFFNSNQINKAAIVDEIAKKIYVSDVDINLMKRGKEEFTKILSKIQKKLENKSFYYIDDDGNIILGEEIAKIFVIRELIELSNKYNIIGTEKLRKYNVRAVKPKITGNFSHSIDFLEGEFEVDIEGEKFSIQQILDSYKRDSYIVLSDGSSALINKKYLEKLERIFLDKEKKKIKLSFFDIPILEDMLDEKLLFANFNAKTEFYEGINKISTDNIKIKNINAELREYQKYGYAWLKYLLQNGFGACLADDMGLGKTLQAITLVSNLKKELGKTLVIMPKSLIFNWENEVKKFSGNLKVGVYYGTNRKADVFDDCDLILTSYGTVRNDVKNLMKIKFGLIILDESQNIKNINSQTTKAVMMLKSDKKLALSGTPIENNLNELYSLFKFLNPDMLGTYEHFYKYYISPIYTYRDKSIIEELRKKIYPFILRRVKKEVLDDLPDKIEKTIYVEMNQEHKKLYEEKRKFYYDKLKNNMNGVDIDRKFFILQAINELRYLTSCPEFKNKNVTSSKSEVLVENIITAVRNNHKVLVFTNYLNSLDGIAKKLEKSNIKYLKMTGETKDRESLVKKFQKNGRYKVFLMTLKTGGVGLNLTAADTIFIHDPWWNKTVESQAVDRAYRLGQDRKVFAYKLILKDTIEEKILQLQEEKRKLLESLIIDDNLLAKKLSLKDIDFILGK